MHAVGLAVDDQLGEHGRDLSVAGGVTDVVLGGIVVGRVDQELVGVRVVRGCRPELLDVRAVTRLGHRKAAGKLQRGSCLQVALVVMPGPELEDGATPQPELNAELDEQREVS